jgi:hypothetical protein
MPPHTTLWHFQHSPGQEWEEFAVLSHCTYDRSRLRGFDWEAVGFDWGACSGCIGLLVFALDLEEILVANIVRVVIWGCLTLDFLEIGMVASVRGVLSVGVRVDCVESFSKEILRV